MAITKYEPCVGPKKYHETITCAWILAARYFMGKKSSSEFADSFIRQNPIMLDAKTAFILLVLSTARFTSVKESDRKTLVALWSNG